MTSRIAKAVGLTAILVFILTLERAYNSVVPYRYDVNSTITSSSAASWATSLAKAPMNSLPSLQAPFSTSKEFPRKVWQTGRIPVPLQAAERAETWFRHNPSYRHEILSDDGGDAYLIDKFSHRPDVVELYLNLRVPILKADLLRYLIMIADGGIWSDLDISCLRPVEEWIPLEYKDRTISMVFGQEFDMPFPGEGQQLASQFANWVFMAKPGTKHLSMVIHDILADFRRIAEENKVDYSGIRQSMLSDVVDVTGPKRMTISLLKSLSIELGENIDDRNISGLTKPVLVGDVLVLPQAAFAAAQGGYPTDQGPYFITHHYAGSWKDGADKKKS